MGKIGKCMAVCCSAIGFLFSGAGHGQSTYPNKAVMVQVGLQAGTGSDIAVRGMLEKLRRHLARSSSSRTYQVLRVLWRPKRC
jgi:hypothetical protein